MNTITVISDGIRRYHVAGRAIQPQGDVISGQRVIIYRVAASFIKIYAVSKIAYGEIPYYITYLPEEILTPKPVALPVTVYPFPSKDIPLPLICID